MIPAAVLFDFDGVIVDSFNSHKSAWISAFRQLFDEELPDFPRDHLTGTPSSEIGRFIAESTGYEDRTDELCALKLEVLMSSEFLPEILPGTTEMFQKLQDNNIPYGIASNAPRAYVQSTINTLGLDCSVALGFEDYTLPKPSPEPYIKCAAQLGVSPELFGQVYVFEDSVTGIVSATEAGMIPIGIGSGENAATLSENGAIRVLTSLHAAVNFIKTS